MTLVVEAAVPAQSATPWIVLGASLASAVVGATLQRLASRRATKESKTETIAIPPLETKPRLSVTERVTLAVAVVAATASIGGAILNQGGALQLEAKKFEESRKDEARKHARAALAELGRDLSVGVQRASWLVWYASNDPTSVNQKALNDYEAFTKDFLPKLVASQTLLAAHDSLAYGKVRGIVFDYYRLDAQITKAGVAFRKNRSAGLTALTTLDDFAGRLQTSLPDRFAQAANVESSGR